MSDIRGFNGVKPQLTTSDFGSVCAHRSFDYLYEERDYPSTVLIQNRYWSPEYEQSAKRAGSLESSLLASENCGRDFACQIAGRSGGWLLLLCSPPLCSAN